MKKCNFKGVWSVVALEQRIRGEWRREADFGPYDWTIGFLEGGRWIEVFRPDDKKLAGRWVFDDRTGLLLTADGENLEFLHHHIFVSDEGGGRGVDSGSGDWLYTFDNAPHIPQDPNQIIAHHAHTRQKIKIL